MRSTLEWDASTGWRERREPEREREPYQRPASPRHYREERGVPLPQLPPPLALSRHSHMLMPAQPPAARPKSPPPPPPPPPPVQRDLEWEKILEASKRAPLPPPPCPTWLNRNAPERIPARSTSSRFIHERAATASRSDAPMQHDDGWFVRVPLVQHSSSSHVMQGETRARDGVAEASAAAVISESESPDDAEYEPKRQRLGWGQGLARASNVDQDAAELASDMRDSDHEDEPAFEVAPSLEVAPLEQANGVGVLPSTTALLVQPQLFPAEQQPPVPAEPELHVSSVDEAGAVLVSKSDVLTDIDRVDVDITLLEARLRKLDEADLEEDDELAEDAAARLPPPRPRPRRPPPPRVVALAPQQSAAADAFAATPAADVLAALGAAPASLSVELFSTGNADCAARAAEAMGLPPDSPALLVPFDSSALLARNAETHAGVRARVEADLARRSAARRAQISSLTLEYRQRQARWVTALAAQTDAGIRLPDPAYLAAPDDGLDGAAELAAERAAERERTHARLPAQLSGSDAHRRVFPGRNALVQAPVSAAADEARARPWSAAERRTFLDKFSLYGKDFARIASHLAARSTADCVVYYYRTQKVDDGFGGKRKAALKKRRQYAAAAAMGFGAVAAFRDADAGRQRERAAPTAEARQEKAALAAAARAAAVSKEKAARAGRGGGAKRRERDAEVCVPLTADEVAHVLEALPRTGKSFRALAQATGLGVASLKSFWTAHRTSYGLDALAAQASEGQTDHRRPGAANAFAASSAPSTLEQATSRAGHTSEALQTCAGAPFASGEAGASGADERGRHPLLTAVQFIRTHANAQLRDDLGDKCEAAPMPAESQLDAEPEAADFGAQSAAVLENDCELGAEMLDSVAELEHRDRSSGEAPLDSDGPLDVDLSNAVDGAAAE